jgi:hypothetical protein
MDEFTINDKNVLEMLMNFSPKMLKQLSRRSLKKALGILARATRSELKRTVNGTMVKHTWNNGKSSSMNNGVRVHVWKDADKASVHIMGDFRLKFFELGTRERHIKKPKSINIPSQGQFIRIAHDNTNRGMIEARHFFKTARAKKEKEVTDAMDKIVAGQVVKINNKYK